MRTHWQVRFHSPRAERSRAFQIEAMMMEARDLKPNPTPSAADLADAAISEIARQMGASATKVSADVVDLSVDEIAIGISRRALGRAILRAVGKRA